MFAKLKKKIEEEVGDLGQLTSPLSNTFGGGDRRVSSAGGSSQGTNTPNNLGSRQSSMASLVDLHPIDENQPVTTTPTSKNAPNSFGPHLSPQPPIAPNVGPPTARSTSNYIASVQQKAMENYESELKRVNNDWGKKLDTIKKTYEEKLQNQEADFAWKYSTKDDEIEKLKVEKRKLEETAKNVEGIYQSKITRAHDDIDQLEGYTKQEMAKVKHLLLNAQADLQKVQGELFQSDIKVKDLMEENQNLKSENDNLLKNLNKLEFGTGKTVKTLEEQLEELRNRTASLESELAEKNKRLDSLFEMNQSLQATRDTLEEELKQAKATVDSKTLENEEMLRTVSSENANLEQEAQSYRSELKQLKEKIVSLTASSESTKESNTEMKRALDELQNVTLEKSMLEKMLDEVRAQFEADLQTSGQQVNELRAKVAALESELPTKEELVNSRALLEKTRDELAVKEDKLKELSKANEAVKSENENLMKNLSESVGSEEIVKTLQNQVNEFKCQIISLEEEAKEKSNELRNMFDTYETLKASNESLLKEVSDTKIKFEKDLERSSTELAEVRQQLSVRSAEAESQQKIEEHLEEARQQVQKLTADNQSLQEALTKTTQRMEEETTTKSHELNELRNKLSALAAEVPSKSELVQAQTDLRQSQDNAIQLEERVKDLANENQQLKSRNEDLVKRTKQALANKDENMKQLKAELETLRENGTALASDTAKKDKELASLSEQIQFLRSQNEELLKALNEKTSKFEAEKSKNEEILMKLNSEYTKSEGERARSDSLLKHLESEKANYEQEKSKHDAVLKDLTEEKSKFEALQSEHTGQLEKLNEEKTKLELENTAYISELKELREKLVQSSSDAKSRDEYEDELKLALDEIEKLNTENDSLQRSLTDQKVKFDSETRANAFELNVLREKLSMYESDVLSKEENDGKLKEAAEELHRLKAENDMLSKSLREEKVKYRKQMKDHASAINELKGKMVEPAVIQSSNSHHTETSNNYTEDVNFQYMRSVLFKFITTSDPQVTKHLTKAVATLLHLNDEEGRLLQKSTDKRIKSWFPVGGEHLS